MATLPDDGPPPAPRVHQRAGFRRACWIPAMLATLFLIGLLLPSPFWRF
jgi:hypothetical protein